MSRIGKENYYLDIAQTVMERGTCLRRNFGAIIVNNDQIISSGYTGAPRGRENCVDRKCCHRDTLGIKRGERYELCRSVHAEANAIIHASRGEMMGGTLYLVGKEINGEYVEKAAPCAMCKKLIINSGISTVVIREDIKKFRVINVNDWIDNDDSITDSKGY